MTNNEFLTLIKQAETSLKNLRFTLDIRLSVKDDAGQQQKTAYSVSASGILATGQDPFYNIRTKSNLFTGLDIGFTIKPDSRTLPDDKQMAFNGTQDRWIHFQDDKPQKGYVLETSHVQETKVVHRGLQVLLPFFRPLLRISDQLPNGLGLSHYLEHRPKDWAPWYLQPGPAPELVRLVIPYDKDLKDLVDIDLSKNAAITACACWSNYGTPTAQISVNFYDIVLAQHNGFWLPESFTHQMAAITTYATIHYDAINGPITPETFLLDFPEGISITTIPSTS